VDGDIALGEGDDNTTNNGSVESVRGGKGEDSITNNGTALEIHGSGGNDVIENNGDVVDNGQEGDRPGALSGGRDDDRITNNGTADEVRGGKGDDTIINTGTTGKIEGGSTFRGFPDNDTNGQDTITNSGTVTGDILAGPGADTVNLATGTQVGGTIDGGDGGHEDSEGDTLNFNMSTADNAEYTAAQAAIAEADESDSKDGQFNWDAGVIEWQNFEFLLDNLILLAAAGAEAVALPAVGEVPVELVAETLPEILDTPDIDLGSDSGGDDGGGVISVAKASDGSIKISLPQPASRETPVSDVNISHSDWSNAQAGDVLVSMEVDGMLVYLVALGNGQFALQCYSLGDGSLMANLIITP